MAPTDDGRDPRRASHAALQGIRRELRRHPAITSVDGHPHDALYTQLRAAIDPLLVGSDAPPGTLTVAWFVRPAGAPPHFRFHYADDTGFDCGWHHHEQTHVDGLGHYQERASDGDSYAYEPFAFNSVEPARVTWEILDEVTAILSEK
ncbi:hypothetical protein [Halovivax cerinus]|uniref:Uncharacterized protein n=1 Tax=Halovivax cerinus TaxID=1487865 RepID=A0ABD5NPV0_9EURY|nr:hypothetical protein [Halovivax cerinus]